MTGEEIRKANTEVLRARLAEVAQRYSPDNDLEFELIERELLERKIGGR